MNIRQLLNKLKTASGDEALDTVGVLQSGTIEKDDFEAWWYVCGSGLAPMDGEDGETHCHRVCAEFYAHMTKGV